MANFPDFENVNERDGYFIKNAKYFTVLRYFGIGRSFERHEVKTLEEAIILANSLVNNHHHCMIYAVIPPSDVFVKSVRLERKNAQDSTSDIPASNR
jgi:hypothetical protein